MQRSFENGFCLFQFVKIPWCHKREMLLEKRNAILLQDIRHKRRTGIMILLIKRYLKQDERQSDNTVVISLSLFIALQKLSCNTFFLSAYTAYGLLYILHAEILPRSPAYFLFQSRRSAERPDSFYPHCRPLLDRHPSKGPHAHKDPDHPTMMDAKNPGVSTKAR